MLPDKPKFPTVATLHFLPSGDFLFVDHDHGDKSKFLTVNSVVSAFSTYGRDTGWMPAGLVRHGQGNKGAWYVYSAPGQKVEIQVDGQALRVPIPRTVLVHYERKVWIWAMNTSAFDPSARAFLAPFPNVYADGHVCWGSNAAPIAEPMKARQVWEMFFKTAFNRDLSNDKCKSYASVVELLKLINGKSKFPAEELMPARDKISTLVENAIKD